MPKIEEKLKELEEKTMSDGFWNDSKLSSKVLQEIKSLKGKYSNFNNVDSETNNLAELNELLLIESDEEMTEELFKNTNKIEKELEKLELEILLSGKYDKNNAILTLHPGARRNRITRLGRNAI